MRVAKKAFLILLVTDALLVAQQQEPQQLAVEPVNTAVGLGGGAGGIFGARGTGAQQRALLGREVLAALQQGVAWLQTRQRESGAFGDDADDLRATALAMLVMLADGSTIRSGPHKDALKRAVNWLREQLLGDGTFGGEACDESLETQAQALATAALVVSFR